MNRLKNVLVLGVLIVAVGATALPIGPVAADESACGRLTVEEPTTPACEAEIAANPAPDVTPLGTDYNALSQYTFMRLMNGDDAAAAITIYNAPDGEPVRALDAGFHFVTVIQQVGEWGEINGGEWVRAVDVQPQQASIFAGVQVNGALKYPLAWILVNAYSAAVPGGSQVIDPDHLHYRYERVNIYATVEVDGQNWYLIAPGEWMPQTWVGIAHNVTRPEGVSGHWIAVDLYEQTLVAYDGAEMVFATLVSSGLPDWDTNEGAFKVWARFASDHMSGAEGASDFYYLENVPYVMYFDGDISLHGTYWHDGFGYRHSHGCVNLSITDARWLFNWTNAEQWHETPVIVFSSGTY